MPPVIAETEGSMEWLLKWWPLLTTAVSVLVGWGYWSLKQRMVPREEFVTAIDELRAADVAIEERIVSVETTLHHLPTRDDLEKVDERISDLTGAMNNRISDLSGVMHDRISNVSGDIRAMTEKVNGLHDVLNRMDRQLGLLLEHHMRSGSDG